MVTYLTNNNFSSADLQYLPDLGGEEIQVVGLEAVADIQDLETGGGAIHPDAADVVAGQGSSDDVGSHLQGTCRDAVQVGEEAACRYFVDDVAVPDSLVEQHLGFGVGDSVLCLQSTGALDQDVLEVLFHLGGDGHQGLGIGRYRFGSFAALEANQIERDVLVLDAYLQQVGKDLDGVGPLPDDVGFGVAAQASAHPHLIVDVVPGRTYFVIGEVCLQNYLTVAMIQCVHFR